MSWRLPAKGLVAGVTFALASSSALAQTASVVGHITAPGLTTTKDTVVSLEAPGLKVTPPARPVEVDQRGGEFVPHVSPVVKGTVVRFLNNDRYRHNVFSPDGHYTLGTWAHGEMRDRTFDTPGVFTQLCRLHDRMEAFIVVLNTPFFTTSDATGAFEIRNVPPGKYTLVAWNATRPAVTRPLSVIGKKIVADVSFAK